MYRLFWRRIYSMEGMAGPPEKLHFGERKINGGLDLPLHMQDEPLLSKYFEFEQFFTYCKCKVLSSCTDCDRAEHIEKRCVTVKRFFT
jgi:hypothetical protein